MLQTASLTQELTCIMSVCQMFHRATLLTQDDVTADESSRMNSEINRAILSAQIQQNAVKLIGQCFRVEIENRPKKH